MNYVPDIGGIFFSRGARYVSRRIAWYTTSKADSGSPTLATHCGVISGRDQVTHANRGFVRTEPWWWFRNHLEETGGEWCVIERAQPVLASDAHHLQDVIRRLSYVGGIFPRRYAFLEIPLQLCDGLLSKARKRDTCFFRRAGDLLPGVVCSGFAGRVCVEMGWLPEKLGDVPTRFADPDLIWDWTLKSMEWTIAEHSTNWILPKAKQCWTRHGL